MKVVVSPEQFDISSGTTNSRLSTAKRLFDVIVASAALVVSAPLIAIAALLIAFDGVPPFFSQQRLGRGGSLFNLYKLRTMCCDADRKLEELLRSNPALRDEFAKNGQLLNDPRVSRIGLILRRSGIDELPQLVNVLKGNMSLVGPRPRTLRWLALPEAESRLFRAYFTVRPGITGSWQVSSQGRLGDLARMKLDAEYAEAPSLRRDLAILLRTLPLFFLGRAGGARSSPSESVVERTGEQAPVDMLNSPRHP